MSVETLQGIKLTLDLDDRQFTKALDNVMRHVSAFSTDLNKLNKALKLEPDNVDLLSSKMALLTEKETEAQAVLEKLTGALEEAKGRGLDEADRRVIRLKTSIAEVNEQLRLTREELKWLNSGLEPLQRAFETLSGAADIAVEATRTLSSISTSLLKGAGETAIEFESAFANVKKTIDETDTTKYEDLSEAIVEMSKTVPTSAAEIANLIGTAGQLGVSADDAIKFAKTMVDLGNSTDITAEEAGVAIAQFYNIVGKDLSTIDNFASALVNLGNNTSTTESNILEMSKYLAAAASSVGISEDHILGMSAALASVGMETSGATALSTIIRKIDTLVNTGSKDLAKWANAFGMTEDQLKWLWNVSPSNALTAIIKSLGDFKDEGGSLAALLDTIGVRNLRQADTITRLAGAYEMLDKAVYETATDGWEKGTYATEEASKMYQTTGAKIEILKNQIKALGVNMSKALLPVLQNVLDTITPILNNVGAWVAENGNLVLSLLTLGAAAHPLMKGLSGFSKGVLQVLKWVQFGVPIATKLALAIGGVGLAVGGTVAVLAAIKDATTEETKEIENLITASDEYTQSIHDKWQAEEDELAHYERLIEEMRTLYDENGNVKEGYENRVEYIKGELYNAGLVEQGILDELIDKQDEYTQAIYDGIDAQRISNYMVAADEEEEEALRKRAELIDWLAENVDKYATAKERVAAGRLPGQIIDFDYDKAKELVTAYELANKEMENTNALLENIQAMRAAYDSGEWAEVINLYNQGVYELVGKGEDEVKLELENMYLYLNDLKEQDDGTALFAALIERTESRFSEMVTSVGYSLEQIEQMFGVASSYKSSINGILSSIQAAGGLISGAAGGGMRSGGFASGGFTLNNTINVSTTQAVTRQDVRNWGTTLADVINEELGKRL